ncbi:MAG: radical SAM-linked protein [Gemmataceae bacterium]
MNRYKVRVRFRKAGDLRFLSHHDLMRVWERLARRAQLPLRFSEGFHPKPRIVFPSALALGIVGHDEVVELELTQFLDPEEIYRRLQAHTVPGLDLVSVRTIPPQVIGQPACATYRLQIPEERVEQVQQCLVALQARSQWTVCREKPVPRQLDARPFVRRLALEGNCLWMELALSAQGSVRAEEVLQLLGIADLLLDGRYALERVRLVLQDELPERSVQPVAARSREQSLAASVCVHDEPEGTPASSDAGHRHFEETGDSGS